MFLQASALSSADPLPGRTALPLLRRRFAWRSRFGMRSSTALLSLPLGERESILDGKHWGKAGCYSRTGHCPTRGDRWSSWCHAPREPLSVSNLGRNVTSHPFHYLHVCWTFNHPGQITFPLRVEGRALENGKNLQVIASPLLIASAVASPRVRDGRSCLSRRRNV